MPYLGNEAAEKFVSKPAVDHFSGDGSTTAFTLSFPVASDQDILVSVDGVVQDTTAYAVSSGTTLTFTAAPSSNSGNNIFVNYLARVSATIAHPSTSALAATTGTFTGALTANDTVTINGTTPTLTIGDAGAEDTKIVFDGNAQDFHIGLDDSADDLVIGLGSALGTTTHMAFTENGEITKPLQPAFSVHKNGTSQSNLAADASSIVITFGTEIYDIGSNFASNTFTAPVTGKYLLSLKVALRQVDKDANYIYIKMLTSNRSYSNLIDADFGTSDMQYWNVDQSFLVDMDANDTVDCRYSQSGGGAQVDIDGTQEYTSFSGVLVC